jgi:hypothetical protein
MNISNWQYTHHDHKLEVAATIDGFRLWYRVPESAKVSKDIEPFLAAALVPAMLKGERIDVETGNGVSGELMSHLYQLQEIYHCWNSSLKVIEINAAKKAAIPPNEGVAAFFSGGVDSSYTFLKHLEEISHIIYISGFDFPCDDNGSNNLIERNRHLIQKFNKTFINVETNFYEFGYNYNISRNLTQGSCLGSVALLMGFNKVFIPSSYSFDQLFPLGSHPLTDHLWSNGNIDIVHDGCEATRTEKLRRLAGNSAILSNLSVCLVEVACNCGHCQKCLRTMISLRLMNVTTEAFPSFPSLKEIRSKRIDGQIEATFLKENIELADQTNNWEIKKALEASLKRYERESLFKHLDKVLLNGKGRELFRMYLRKQESSPRIDFVNGEF